MSDAPFFPGFETIQRQVERDVEIHGVMGGQGPPLLLLQGWPQSHLEWRHVAPALAKHFTVVATDLRGYGSSSKPAHDETHAAYSKRVMARDQVEVMRQLGFAEFAVAGHDRGGRVAHRMALDHPQAVQRVALLDIVPTLTVYSTVNKALATAYFHWFALIQPAPLPETMFRGAEELFLRHYAFNKLVPAAIPEDVFAQYLRCFSDAATLHAMCEDYRAAATIDLEHDRADLERRIECPTLILWGERGAMHQLYDVLATWQPRAANVYGKSLPAGHWLPEECPAEVSAALLDFLS